MKCTFPTSPTDVCTVVGYNQVEVAPNNWYLIGAGFADVSGSNISIQKLVTGLTAEEEYGYAPLIQYWDADQGKLVSAVYTTFSYYFDENDPNAQDGIVFLGDSWAFKIGDEEGMTCFKTFAPGEACWFTISGTDNQTATFAGAVQADPYKDVVLSTDWQFVGNPYPVAYNLNDTTKVDCSGLTAQEEYGYAPLIQYWDLEQGKLISVVYTTFSYYFDEDDPNAQDGMVFLGDSWAFKIGEEEGMTCLWEFAPCQGYWATLPMGSGSIRFIR